MIIVIVIAIIIVIAIVILFTTIRLIQSTIYKVLDIGSIIIFICLD